MAVNERDQELHGSMVDNDGHSTVGNFYYRWMARSEYDNLPTMLEPIEAISCDKDKMMEEDLESERMDVCEQIENNLLSQQGGVNKISQDIQGNHDLQECTADYDSEQELHEPMEDDEVSSSLYNRWMTQSEDNNHPTMLEAINRDKDNEDEPMEVDKQMEDNLPPQQGGVSSDDDGDDLSKPTFETKSATKIPSSSLKSPALNIARSYDVLDDWIDIDDDEDPDYLAAIEASLKDQNSQNNEILAPSTSKEEVKDILKKFISKNIVEDGDNTLNILVSRKAILQSTLGAIERKSFSFEMPMFVKFAGEDGIDAGGPKREFFRLLMQNIKGIGIFDGSGWFVHDLTLLKQRKYELAGKLITWSILHGGPGPKCLAMEAFSIVQDKPIDLEKVIKILSDVKLKEILKSLQEAKEAEFPNVIEKHGDDIAEYGYSAIYTSKSSDKMKIVDCLLKQSFLFSVYAEVEQFRKGMNMVGGFGDIVFENYAVFHTVLGNNQDELTSNIIKANYRVNFSEAGSNNKEKELETIYCFELFLQDLEEGEVDDDLHLSDLMIFITGADCVPPLGFDNPISIEFYDHSDREQRLPWSSTCSLSLNLPRGITDPLTMRVMMCRCLKEGQGFGKC